MDLLLRQAGDQRDDGADHMRGLKRAVDREIARDLVEADDALAGLQRARMDPLVGEEVLGRHLRFGESGVGQLAVADGPGEDVVGVLAGPVRPFGFVLDVLAQDRGVGVHGLERIDHDRQRLVFDLNKVGRVGGNIAIRRDNEGDLLVLEQHFPVSEHHLHVARESRHPGEIDAFQILGGQDRQNARQRFRLGRVDLDDSSVAVARAMEIAMQHARQLDIVDVVPFSLREAHVLDALALAPHALQLVGAFERRGRGRSVHSAASLNSIPLSLAAAYWIALTMFW